MREYSLNKIFVEGISDKLFVDFILREYFNIDDPELVVATRGKDKLVNQPDLANVRRKEERAKNLLIFDTDYNNDVSKGGRQIRIQEYKEIANSLNITFDIYLLPFDDEREGILEHLLNTFFKEEFDYFDNCWNDMLRCLNNTDLEKLNIPAQKAFIYSKIDLFKNYRLNKWDYKNSVIYDYSDSGIWNLDTESNAGLRSLIKFIDQNLFN